MSEMNDFKGKMLLKKQDLMIQENRITGAVLGLRTLLDPTLPVHDLQTDVIAEQALLLANLHADYEAIRSEIKTIQRVIG